MRTAFIKTLCNVAAVNPDVWLLCADLGYSVLEVFREQFPDRYLNVGVAEQNMVGIAAGLAHSGKIPFIYSIANFPTLRCLEQIRNDVCYHNLPVKVVAVGGGFTYGSLGYTHHGVEDLAVMRTLPGMTVTAPGDPIETQLIVHEIANERGPGYLRLGKANEPIVHEGFPDLAPGKSIQIQDGQSVTLISTGGILTEVVRAARMLEAQDLSVRVISMPYVVPFDAAAVLAAAAETDLILSVEEHGVGGLASAISEVLAVNGSGTRYRPIFVARDRDHVVGSPTHLRQAYGLSAESILQTAVEALKCLR